MTYWGFHLVFTLPLLTVLAFVSVRAVRRGRALSGGLGGRTGFAVGALFLHVLIALVYTTPWDNYLVYREVWGYAPGRVLFTIGYVPVEEYFFFVVQTLLAGLLLFGLARWRPRWAQAGTLEPAFGARLRVGGVVFSLAIAAAGLLLLRTERGTYLGLILVWAGPVLALLWGYAGDWFAARWRLTLTAILVPTLYLWVADRIAIALNIWWISPEFTTGFKPLGLPIEEAVFFLLTTTFVVFGLSASLEPRSLERLSALSLPKRAWWRPLLVLWSLSMVPTPLLPGLFPVLAYVSTTLLALGVLSFAWERYGARSLLLFAVAFFFGLAVEAVGSRTGVPFGAYTYTAPGPTLLGVPLLVLLGWWAFTLIAIAVAPRWKVLVAPLALVAWDLGLDPLMVSRGFWHFDAAAPYYGVPLSNFLGWYVAGVGLVWLLVKLEPRLKNENSADLRIIFLAQAFLMSVGLLFFGLPLAAGVTFVAMGLLLVPTLLAGRLSERPNDTLRGAP